MTGRGNVNGLRTTWKFIAILLGNGDRSFQAPVFIDLGVADTIGAKSIAAGNFDSDDVVDLVISEEVTHKISFFQGNGDGTFTASASTSAGIAATDFRIGDFDGDTELDIFARSQTTNQIAVLLGQGNGSFGAASIKDVGNTPTDLAIADLDGIMG